MTISEQLISGGIGIVGAAVGFVLERLLRRWGRVQIILSDVRFFFRGQDAAEAAPRERASQIEMGFTA